MLDFLQPKFGLRIYQAYLHVCLEPTAGRSSNMDSHNSPYDYRTHDCAFSKFILPFTRTTVLTNMQIIWRLYAFLQEKTRKILDIWTKNNTFPSSVLTRLGEFTKGSLQKGAYLDSACLLSTSSVIQPHYFSPFGISY